MNTNEYKIKLEAEKDLLEKELATVGRRNPSNLNDWEAHPQEVGQESDPNDQADALGHFADNSAILTDLENRYNQVLAALLRIDTNVYGICVYCANPIELDRLNAQIAADTCKLHMSS
jgi:RNA polymerase-binding transcription factor DksA